MALDGLPVEVAEVVDAVEAVESARSVRNLVVSSMMGGLYCER